MGLIRRNIAGGEIFPGMSIYLGRRKNARASGRMRWQVLEYDPEKETLLVMAEENVGDCPFSYSLTDGCLWETSTLRRWLNGGFFDQQFNEEEKKAILEETIPNPANSWSRIGGARDTKDRVWVLSADEADDYLEKGMIFPRIISWLRTAGADAEYAAQLWGDLKVDSISGCRITEACGVLPVMRLDLKAGCFWPYVFADSRKSFSHLYAFLMREKEKDYLGTPGHLMDRDIPAFPGYRVPARTIPDLQAIERPEERKAAEKKLTRILAGWLREDYFTGRSYSPESWRTEWLVNPLCRRLSEKLVWVQGEACFVVKKEELSDAFGKAYFLTPDPVRLAHPMEMSTESVRAYREYFRKKKIRQPFPQLSERVAFRGDLSPERYRGILFPSSLKEELAAGEMDVKIKPYREKAWIGIESISPGPFPRKDNHLLARLDRFAVIAKILSDDPGAANYLAEFSPKVRAAFEDLAERNGCFAVKAAIMDWRHENEGEKDPMEEFGLEEW